VLSGAVASVTGVGFMGVGFMGAVVMGHSSR
jgi:hypothetical protein